MIQYSKSSIRIAELHFDEVLQPGLESDVVRYQWRFQKEPGTFWVPCQTRFIDLNQDPDRILGAMSPSNRNKIRKGYKESITVDFHAAPTMEVTEEFYGFYDEFASTKRLPLANRARLGSMRASGSLVLSCVRNSEGDALSWHCHLRHRDWARLVYSSSRQRSEGSPEGERTLSQANRHLHWRDMLALRELGVSIYDFGGWYGGDTDKAKLNINAFKEGFGGAVVQLHNTYQGLTVKGQMAVYLHRMRGGE